MRLLRMFVAAVSIWSFGFSSSTHACSTLMVPNSNAKLMGKNYVWQLPHGRLFHNRIGMRKKAMLEDESQEALEWVSKYTSLTFNQFAENFPIGGMNSEGLAIEVLLARADFPKTTEKKAVNELQWVQYLLDTSSTVAEAMENAKKVDILPLSTSSIHYHVCDRTGDCAAVEYIDRELVISHKKEDGVCPLSVTNSRATQNNKREFFEAEDLSFDSLDARLLPPAEMATQTDPHVRGLLNLVGKSKSPEEEVADMYRALERMSGQPQWQIVYELKNNRVHFKTQIGGRIHHTVAFNDFDKPYDKSCKEAVFFHKGANKWLVLPPSRFDLAGRGRGKNAGGYYQTFPRETSVSTLKRSDFSLVNTGATLIEQSRAFLRSSGLSEDMLERLELYQNTHTGCADEDEAKAEDAPSVSKLLDESEVQALLVSYEAGGKDWQLARYEGPVSRPNVALALNTPKPEAKPTPLTLRPEPKPVRPAVEPKPEVAIKPAPLQPTLEPKPQITKPKPEIAKTEPKPEIAKVEPKAEPSPEAPKSNYRVGFRYFYSNDKGLHVRSVNDRTGYRNAIQIFHSNNDPSALSGLWVRVRSAADTVSRVTYPNQRGWQPLLYNRDARAAEAAFFL
ncbi:MAG: linear amide C-N hydrolase, partial [Bdellovibrionales bacterium]|nr:linear amide C-N hydrolase [Bdellovibrionales bacterium]